VADVPPDVQVQVARDLVDEGHGAPTLICRAVRGGRGAGDGCGGCNGERRRCWVLERVGFDFRPRLVDARTLVRHVGRC
jgi:hypothetical protein